MWLLEKISGKRKLEAKVEDLNEHDNSRDEYTNLSSNKAIATIDKFKEMAKSAVRDVANPPLSQFHDWESDELRQLLVENNIQVRDSAHASQDTLVRICDEVFRAEEKTRSRLYTLEDLGQMDWAARRIQKVFINSKRGIHINGHDSRHDNQEYHGNPQAVPYGHDSDTDDGDSARSHEYDEIISDDGSDSTFNDTTRQSHLDLLNSPDGSLTNNCTSSHTKQRPSILRRIGKGNLDQEIEVAWRKPSCKFAKKYDVINRPHRSGKAMKNYNWRRDTLGRHCTSGGCGAQLDLWNEGHTSEFSQFGSGVTNYFKFLKWCCWVMFILSLIHIPAIIINMFGASVQYESNIVARTTLGNLGSAIDVHTVLIPACDKERYHFENCTIIKNQIASWYVLMDGTGTILVIIAWIWLRTFEKKEVEHLNRATVSASDYTLRATSIPPQTSERELAVHFANITGEAVAEVNIAFQNSEEIGMYFKRGKLMRKRFDCVQRIRYEKTVGVHNYKKKKFDKRVKKLLCEREKYTALLRLADDVRASKVNPSPIAIQAFVTFETEDGFMKAISAYQLRWIRYIWCFYPRSLRFKGMKLSVSQAPEPSTIIWENLETSERSRFFRKLLTTCIASLAILFSIYFTFLARDFKTQILKASSKPCPEKFFELKVERQYDIIEQDISLSHCYCSTLDMRQQFDEDLCRDYVEGQLKSSAMSYGAGFMVCFMNAFFTWLMDKAGSFEKHESLDLMEGSNMIRVFFLKFVNTGCLVLLYNKIWIQRLMGVRFEDDPGTFDVNWYETGGVSMMIVMCLNIIMPHVGPLLQYKRYIARIRKVERRCTKTGETDDKLRVWYTQEELNAIYLGPQFCLNYRYTQLLVNFYICWMYAISMPVLTVIGAISFLITYWVDKFLFCNFYRIPPKYSDDIGSKSTRLIECSIILHIFMSTWILGNNYIFAGEKNSSEAEMNIILNKRVIPLESIALVLIGGHIAKHFFSGCGSTIMKCLRCMICSRGIEVKKLKSVMNTVRVNYSNARARGVIKGLASYNILQNPKYQEAFQISPEFAMSRNRLSSIRGLNTKEGGLCISNHSSNDGSTVEEVP